ncbi:flagellar motor protein MotB [Alloalcanivorax gelatiniphagus]|uniref:Flagellar motor protein MotB n=1 Tax=Alloalcanivorax gelatiniphagus TaxID=1194167 RepID=A0ABY2XFR3_9GAMM|nr:flagellar motor protein MotB [Alloalcanivorax gelatiniphagus]TMW10429.1 flagellar motor protein MotB [Alloalcanivorax gelatiniphagus]|tara:strand:- start:12879 stop:13751 length:873 start_codon:yes stop_codon:yes gene_type:complete
MSNNHRTIVIRRPRRAHAAHHGGAWKIALADFMTALMALFLVLWILSTATPSELQGLAEYFRTPLKVALANGDRNSASTSAIPGGGADPAHSDGEQARIDLKRQSRPAEDRARLMELRRRMETVIQEDPALRNVREQMRFEMTQDGLRVQLMDTDRQPMFELGSDRVSPAMRKLLRTLAPLLNDVPNRLSISGHTDSLRYARGDSGYSNWELSSDRANASRRELVAGGLDGSKLLRVTGMGDRVPVPGSNPGDAVNRRITLVVLSDSAARRLQAGSRSDVSDLPSQRVPD